MIKSTLLEYLQGKLGYTQPEEKENPSEKSTLQQEQSPQEQPPQDQQPQENSSQEQLSQEQLQQEQPPQDQPQEQSSQQQGGGSQEGEVQETQNNLETQDNQEELQDNLNNQYIQDGQNNQETQEDNLENQETQNNQEVQDEQNNQDNIQPQREANGSSTNKFEKGYFDREEQVMPDMNLTELMDDISDNNEEDLYDEDYYSNLLDKIKEATSADSILKDLGGDEVKLEVSPNKRISPKWWYDISKLFKTFKPIDNSYRRLNKKLLHTGVILPSKSSPRKKIGEVVECHIYLDTSGSMSITDLNIAMSTLQLAKKYFPNKIKMFHFTTNLLEVKPNNIFKNKIYGSGGTSIDPVVSNIIREDKRVKKDRILNIIISDGGFSFDSVEALYKKASCNIVTVFLITDRHYYLRNAPKINNKNYHVYLAVDSDVVQWIVPEKLRKEVNNKYE